MTTCCATEKSSKASHVIKAKASNWIHVCRRCLQKVQGGATAVTVWCWIKHNTFFPDDRGDIFLQNGSNHLQTRKWSTEQMCKMLVLWTFLANAAFGIRFLSRCPDNSDQCFPNRFHKGQNFNRYIQKVKQNKYLLQ
jgi:hypothetical protein